MRLFTSYFFRWALPIAGICRPFRAFSPREKIWSVQQSIVEGDVYSRFSIHDSRRNRLLNSPIDPLTIHYSRFCYIDVSRFTFHEGCGCSLRTSFDGRCPSLVYAALSGLFPERKDLVSAAINCLRGCLFSIHNSRRNRLLNSPIDPLTIHYSRVCFIDDSRFTFHEGCGCSLRTPHFPLRPCLKFTH
jgi:hypothetical protein